MSMYIDNQSLCQSRTFWLNLISRPERQLWHHCIKPFNVLLWRLHMYLNNGKSRFKPFIFGSDGFNICFELLTNLTRQNKKKQLNNWVNLFSLTYLSCTLLLGIVAKKMLTDFQGLKKDSPTVSIFRKLYLHVNFLDYFLLKLNEI